MEDLETVLEDSIRRYEHFLELEAEEGYRPDRISFPFHALLLLGEPGRNDPCPCGSGKKYKHCCME